MVTLWFVGYYLIELQYNGWDLETEIVVRLEPSTLLLDVRSAISEYYCAFETHCHWVPPPPHVEVPQIQKVTA